MKYTRSLFCSVLLLLFCFLIYMPIFFFISSAVYPFLGNIAPNLFPTLYPLTKPEEYKAVVNVFSAISLILTLLISNYMRHYLDNERYERVISKTDGMQPAFKVYPFYIKRYLLPDTVSALICPIIYLLLAFMIPERIIELYIPFVLDVAVEINGGIGIIIGYLIMSLTLTLSNLLSPIKAINKWSAVWLSLGAVSDI